MSNTFIELINASQNGNITVVNRLLADPRLDPTRSMDFAQFCHSSQ
jgi:hypothetical protein